MLSFLFSRARALVGLTDDRASSASASHEDESSLKEPPPNHVLHEGPSPVGGAVVKQDSPPSHEPIVPPVQPTPISWNAVGGRLSNPTLLHRSGWSIRGTAESRPSSVIPILRLNVPAPKILLLPKLGERPPAPNFGPLETTPPSTARSAGGSPAQQPKAGGGPPSKGSSSSEDAMLRYWSLYSGYESLKPGRCAVSAVPTRSATQVSGSPPSRRHALQDGGKEGNEIHAPKEVEHAAKEENVGKEEHAAKEENVGKEEHAAKEENYLGTGKMNHAVGKVEDHAGEEAEVSIPFFVNTQKEPRGQIVCRSGQQGSADEAANSTDKNRSTVGKVESAGDGGTVAAMADTNSRSAPSDGERSHRPPVFSKKDVDFPSEQYTTKKGTPPGGLDQATLDSLAEPAPSASSSTPEDWNEDPLAQSVPAAPSELSRQDRWVPDETSREETTSTALPTSGADMVAKADEINGTVSSARAAAAPAQSRRDEDFNSCANARENDGASSPFANLLGMWEKTTKNGLHEGPGKGRGLVREGPHEGPGKRADAAWLEEMHQRRAEREPKPELFGRGAVSSNTIFSGAGAGRARISLFCSRRLRQRRRIQHSYTSLHNSRHGQYIANHDSFASR